MSRGARVRGLIAGLALLALLACVPACGVVPGWLTQKKFTRKYAREACDRRFDCDAVAAAEAWTDEKTCRKTFRRDLRDAYGAKCDYHHRQARTCLDGLRELACDAPDDEVDGHFAACDEVWTCP